MQRDIEALGQAEYDIIIVGGGINGAACALDASLRGLRVAVLEKNDFGWASSSNSAKIAHSGIRYLQHADFARMRESIKERNLLIQNAPHLVSSQPVLFPLYGHGIKGPEVMTAYVKIYDLLSPERKRFADPARRIPDAKVISKSITLEIAPGVPQDKLGGAAVWPEGQIYNTERLVMAVIRSAEQHGARFANYIEVTGLTITDDKVVGVSAKDAVTGKSIALRGKLVINASGPWLNKTLGLANRPVKATIAGAKAFSLLTRSLCDTHALSFTARAMYRDTKAIADKGSSVQFAIPWRGHSLIGSLHLPCDDDPENAGISEDEIETYLEMINEGYPAAKLKRSDVKRVLWGMIPGEEQGSAAPEKHFKIVDHAQEDGLNQLISVAGVKLTTSRDVASRSIDLACQKLGLNFKSRTDATPLWGGEISNLNNFMSEGQKALSGLPTPVARRLLGAYGAHYAEVLAVAEGRPELLEALPGSDVLKAEVVYAVTEEMALSLGDVVLRRTDLGSLQHPGDEALHACAGIMAELLHWTSDRIEEEIQTVSTTSGYDGRFHA